MFWSLFIERRQIVDGDKNDPIEAKRSTLVIDERLRDIYNMRNRNQLKIKRIDRPHDKSKD